MELAGLSAIVAHVDTVAEGLRRRSQATNKRKERKARMAGPRRIMLGYDASMAALRGALPVLCYDLGLNRADRL